MVRKSMSVLVAVGVLCAGALAQDASIERRIAELAAARHEGKENGWEHLQRALAAAGQAEREAEQRWEGAGRRGDHPGLVAGELRAGPLPREGVEHGVWYVRRAGELGAFDALNEMARIGQAWQPPEEAGVDLRDEAMMERLQRISSVRDLARLLATSMRMAAVDGDADEQAARFDSGLALASAVADRLGVLDRLVAHALLQLMLDEARHQIVDGLIDGAAAREMLSAIDARLPLAPLEASRRVEALNIIDMAAPAEHGRDLDALVAAIVEASRDPDLAEPGPEAFEGEPDLETIAQLLAASVRESLQTAQSVEPQLQMYVDGTRIALALEVYRDREGKYPETLDALAPGILRQIPEDALSGLPFGYRKLEAPDDRRRSYLLWSAGADGEDNDGRTHPDGAHLAQTEQGAGFDIVLNAWRGPVPER